MTTTAAGATAAAERQPDGGWRVRVTAALLVPPGGDGGALAADIPELGASTVREVRGARIGRLFSLFSPFFLQCCLYAHAQWQHASTQYRCTHTSLNRSSCRPPRAMRPQRPPPP